MYTEPVDFAAIVNARLEKLERQNWRLKVLGTVFLFLMLVLAVVGGILLLPGSKPLKAQRSVEAGSFVLLDEHGKMCAELSARENFTGLSIYSKDGKLRISLCENAGGGAMLFLYSEEQDQELVSLYAYKDGSVIALHDENGQKRAELVATKKDLHFRLFDETGKPLQSKP